MLLITRAEPFLSHCLISCLWPVLSSDFQPFSIACHIPICHSFWPAPIFWIFALVIWPLYLYLHFIKRVFYCICILPSLLPDISGIAFYLLNLNCTLGVTFYRLLTQYFVGISTHSSWQNLCNSFRFVSLFTPTHKFSTGFMSRLVATAMLLLCFLLLQLFITTFY